MSREADNEIDLDDMEHVSDIANIMADDKNFYVFANKKDNKLGYYLFRINLEAPTKAEYLIKWMDKLNIEDCDL